MPPGPISPVSASSRQADRGRSGGGHGRGRVTVREGIVLDPQLAVIAPAIQSINATSTGVGPSLVGQLRAKAHCHRTSSADGGLYQESSATASKQSVIRPQKLAASTSGIFSIGQAVHPGPSKAEQSAFLQLANVHYGLRRRFPATSLEPQCSRSKPRHHEAFSRLARSGQCTRRSWRSLVGLSSRGTYAIAAVKMVRPRGQAGAWSPLLRSYLSQCDRSIERIIIRVSRETRFRVEDRGWWGFIQGIQLRRGRRRAHAGGPS